MPANIDAAKTVNPVKYLGASVEGNRALPYNCARFAMPLMIASATARFSGSTGDRQVLEYDNASGLAVYTALLITHKKT